MADSRYITYASNNRFFRDKPYKDLVSSKRWKEFISKDIDKYSFKITTVPNSMEYRPDLIANAAYGDDRLWWFICAVNNIIDPNTELVSGKQLKLPII